MIAAAIPLKALAGAKSRLAPHLPDAERRRLVTELIERTVRVLRGCASIDRLSLVTPEIDLALRLGVEFIADRGSLNLAVEDAQRWATESGAEGLLVVPADLPLLSRKDVLYLLASAPPAPSVTVAPTRDGGTGALLLRPANVITPAFGPQSFEEHRRLASASGAQVSEVHREGFAADLDTAEDLKKHGPHPLGGWGQARVVHPSD
jgi:2-phospho-L-lactate/phosphoenolpyruvate guanylyltransferase